MGGDPPVDVSFQSEAFTFRELWFAARQLRELSEEQEQGRSSMLGARLFVCTAYEGFLNDLGERIAPVDWKDERKLGGLVGKGKYLAKQLGVIVQDDARPFATIVELHTWRNALVHPRTVRRADTVPLTPDVASRRAVADVLRFDDAVLDRALEDVAAFANQLVAAARAKHRDKLQDYGTDAFMGPIGTHRESLIPRKP